MMGDRVPLISLPDFSGGFSCFMLRWVIPIHLKKKMLSNSKIFYGAQKPSVNIPKLEAYSFSVGGWQSIPLTDRQLATLEELKISN